MQDGGADTLWSHFGNGPSQAWEKWHGKATLDSFCVNGADKGEVTKH